MQGAFRLFRFAGTDVFVHWSWFIAGYFLIQNRSYPYTSYGWDVAQYVSGFVLVLLHEFGHVLACRQVGGTANRIVLWPLGGLAFVEPPARPGAWLWTTAAGPLVNVVLAPILIGAALLTMPPENGFSDLGHFTLALAVFNSLILVFNLLPIYPMDGGRILQAILWFCVGRAWSLAIAAGIGMVASALLCVVCLFFKQWWLATVTVFLLLGAMAGFSQSRFLGRLAVAERRREYRCPNCGASPPIGAFWRCSRCFGWFDVFWPETTCPKGDNHVTPETCPDCGRPLEPSDWHPLAPTMSGEPPAI
jgi:Zn-dependent protease